MNSGSIAQREGDPRPFRYVLGGVVFITSVFFLNFLSRIALAPLMPAIEKDLGLDHSDAGLFFFLISSGYLIGLLGSGFLSSRVTHRKTIVVSSLGVGGALVGIALSQNLWVMRIGLLLMGMAAGTYLPSGMATITSLARPKDWGKAIAVHEFAPNVSFIAAPLITQVFMGWFSWAWTLGMIGIIAVAVGAAFAWSGRGGTFYGEAPSRGSAGILIRLPAFWIMMILFSFGIGGSLGVYTMLPLYLVTERHMSQETANVLVGCSRIAVLGAAFVAGWVSDRVGARRTLMGIFLGSGIATIVLGTCPGSWVVPVLFFQPLIAACFFPPAFSALSRIGPPRVRSVSVSLTVPVAFLLGGGAVPAILGYMGEYVSFSWGLAFFGGLLVLVVLLVKKLELHEGGAHD